MLYCAAFTRHRDALAGGVTHHHLCGGHTMPSAPDWRSASAYAYLHEFNAAEFAAEFLRRNPAYRRDYRVALNRARDGRSTAPLTRWGLRFPFRPRRARRPNPSSLAATPCACRCSSRPRARGISRGAQHRYIAADIPACRKRWRVRSAEQSSGPHSRRAYWRCYGCDARRRGHPSRSEFPCPR